MKLSTRCTLCNHPEREKINYLILLGRVKVQDLCDHYGFSDSAVYRHRAHLEASLEEAREGLRVLALEELIENLSRALSTAWWLIDEAKAAGDRPRVLGGLREVHRLTKTLGKHLDGPDFQPSDLTVYRAVTTDADPKAVTSLEAPPSFRQRRRRFIRDTFHCRCHDEERQHQVFQALNKSNYVMPPPEWKDISDYVLNIMDPDGLRFTTEIRRQEPDAEYEPDPPGWEGGPPAPADPDAAPAMIGQVPPVGPLTGEAPDDDLLALFDSVLSPRGEPGDKWENSGEDEPGAPPPPSPAADLREIINLRGNPGESDEVPPLAPVSYRRPGPPPEAPLSPEEFARELIEMNERLCRKPYAGDW